MNGQPAVRVRIGTLRVTARSAVEARRLADALPAALERALREAFAADGSFSAGATRDGAARGAATRDDATGRPPRRRDGANRVADAVVAELRVRLDASGQAGDRS